MVETADFPQDDRVSRSYAAWATRSAPVPRFIKRRAAGTMIRIHSGRLGNLALALCAASFAGLAAIAILALQ